MIYGSDKNNGIGKFGLGLVINPTPTPTPTTTPQETQPK